MARGVTFVWLVLVSCTGLVVDPHAGAPARVRAESPIDGTRPTRKGEGEWSDPTALWVQQGQLVVLDGVPKRRVSLNTFEDVPVGTSDAPQTLGVVRALTTRGSGILLAASNGLFHDASGRLVESPLTQNFEPGSIRFIDDVQSPTETLWVTTTLDAWRVADGLRESISLDDETEHGALQAAIGTTATSALVVKGTTLYAVDLEAAVATRRASGLGTVTALSRGADGTVWLATTQGLFSATADVVTQHTLAPARAPAQAALAVVADGDSAVVLTKTQLIRVEPTQTTLLTEVTAARANALARDASGDLFTLDGAQLVRLTAQVDPKAPSFSADIKPFFEAHCTSCHSTGAQYSPTFDLTDIAVAKRKAGSIARRLADPQAPMPPQATEVLTPSQYDVVLRWVNGGFRP